MSEVEAALEAARQQVMDHAQAAVYVRSQTEQARVARHRL